MNFPENRQRVLAIFSKLVLVKIVLITLAFLFYNRFLFIGEKHLPAAGEPVPLEENEKSKGGAKDLREDTSADNEEDGEESDENSASTRHSFLEDLLTMPELKKDKLNRDELGRYLSLAEQKLQQIEAKTKLLAEREKSLISIENKIDEKLKSLQDERRFYSESIQKEKQIKEERLEKLLSLYKKMEPKKAAAVIENLDRDLVVALFKGLPEKQTTRILELMNPEKSTKLSEYFGRIKSGREFELLKEVNVSLLKEFEICRGAASKD